MFKLKVLSSSSKANGYVLTNGEDSLFIEAGKNYREALVKADYNALSINGMLVTHEHTDHARCIKQYVNRRIPIYMPGDTMKNLNLECEYNVRPIELGQAVRLGNFTIHAFECKHSVTCYGYIIWHKKLGKLLFATDTEFIKYSFKDLGLKHICIEANYSKNLLNRDDENSTHVLQGHMEIGTTADFLRENATSKLKNVVLLHLSDKNSDEKLFKEIVAKEVPETTKIYVADRGMEIVL